MTAPCPRLGFRLDVRLVSEDVADSFLAAFGEFSAAHHLWCAGAGGHAEFRATIAVDSNQGVEVEREATDRWLAARPPSEVASYRVGPVVDLDE